MHTHLSRELWLDAFDEIDDRPPDAGLLECPRCSPALPDAESWSLLASSCPRCKEALDATLVSSAEALQCEVCLAALDDLWQDVERLEHFNPTVAIELKLVPVLSAELQGLCLRDQMARVVCGSNFHQWAFYQHLLSEARGLWHKDPEAALERSLLAAEIADRLDPETYQPEWTADLRAKAHAYLANSFRVVGQFATAEESFLDAEREVSRGTGGGRVEALVLSLKASLLIYQYRYLEAEALLKQVEASHVLHDDLHEAGRVMLKRAKLFHCQEKYREAAAEVERAASHLDPEIDPLMPIAVRINAAGLLLEAGDILAAREVFDSLPEIEEPMVALRRSWIEGRLLSAGGDHELAIDVLSEARDELSRRDLSYLAGMISLDLALVAFKIGRLSAVRGYAEEAMVLIGRAPAAPHETIAAVRLVLVAAERKTLSLALLEASRKRLATRGPGV